MEILVFLKSVSEKKEIGEGRILSDSDINVLSEALDIKDEQGGRVTVVALGAELEKELLKEALTYGADRAIIVSHEGINFMNIGKASKIMAKIVRDTGHYDLFLFGRQAADGDSAHIAVMTALNLQIPLIPYAKQIEIVSNGVCGICEGEAYDQKVFVSFPAIILSIKERRKQRYPIMSEIIRVYQEDDPVETVKCDCLQEENPDFLMKLIGKRNWRKRTGKVCMIKTVNEDEKGKKLLEVLRNLKFL